MNGRLLFRVQTHRKASSGKEGTENNTRYPTGICAFFIIYVKETKTCVEGFIEEFDGIHPTSEASHAEQISFYHEIIGIEGLEQACPTLLAFNKSQMVALMKLFLPLIIYQRLKMFEEFMG